MNPLRVISIILFIGGFLIFAAGLAIIWLTNPISEYGTISLVVGFMFIVAAIVFLCFSEQYDPVPSS